MSKKLFLDSLIDDFGIRHHTDGYRWLKATGYSLDDAARGLLLCLALDKTAEAGVLLGYIEKSLKGSDFYGFATAKQHFNTYPSSDDAKGQVVWALGYALSVGFESARCRKILAQIQDSLTDMRHIRGPAYALLGAVYFDMALAGRLAAKLDGFMKNCSDEWYWPEPVMTYGNGIIPSALLRYSQAAGDDAAGRSGRQLLAFLQKTCAHKRVLGPIGNDGWFRRGSARPADYSQQPVDSAYMVLAWLAEYRISGSAASLNQAKRWLDWFEGNNIASQKMYDMDGLKAYDGIDHQGVNLHSGAESNICMLLARWTHEKRRPI